MEEATPKQNYELAFHIDPNLEEAKVREVQDEVEKFVSSTGAVVTHVKAAEKTRLSYPIGHQRQSFFGHINFSLADTSKLAELDEHLRLNTAIVRHLVLKLETDAQRQKAISKAATAKEKQEQRAKQAAEVTEKKDTAELEKQIEEVIGGL